MLENADETSRTFRKNDQTYLLPLESVDGKTAISVAENKQLQSSSQEKRKTVASKFDAT